MVHFENTFPANTAVMGSRSRRFNELTLFAVPKIQDIISEVADRSFQISHTNILVEQGFCNSIFSVNIALPHLWLGILTMVVILILC